MYICINWQYQHSALEETMIDKIVGGAHPSSQQTFITENNRLCVSSGNTASAFRRKCAEKWAMTSHRTSQSQ